MVEHVPLKLNASIELGEKGGPAIQRMARIGEDMFGIPGYMDSSGEFSEGICQPCEYKKYLTYKLVNDATGVGAACVIFFPCWGFELMVCKILPQWSTCIGSACQNGLVIL